MSQLLISRFETKNVKKDATVMVGTDRTIIVKDHTTDNVVMVVNYAKTSEENMEIAELFIETLEKYISDVE